MPLLPADAPVPIRLISHVPAQTEPLVPQVPAPGWLKPFTSVPPSSNGGRRSATRSSNCPPAAWSGGMSNRISSGPAISLAQMIASRRVQSPASSGWQAPSSPSSTVFTTQRRIPSDVAVGVRLGVGVPAGAVAVRVGVRVGVRVRVGVDVAGGRYQNLFPVRFCVLSGGRK